MIQLSGPSGKCFAASTVTGDDGGSVLLIDGGADRRFSGEDLRCGGSVMIFDSSRDILRILKSYSDFFVAESCGICVPCRTGNFLLNKKLQKLINGHGQKSDLADIRDWSQIIKTTSRCGLGQMANESLILATEKFPDVFDAALNENADFSRSFDLDAATAEYDRIIDEINASYE
jgi:[NiFe] hydrogenase diaphorase moiety large subunit